MTESPRVADDEEDALPGELPFDQELDFSKEFSDDDYTVDVWDEDPEDDSMESDDDY